MHFASCYLLLLFVCFLKIGNYSWNFCQAQKFQPATFLKMIIKCLNWHKNKENWTKNMFDLLKKKFRKIHISFFSAICEICKILLNSSPWKDLAVSFGWICLQITLVVRAFELLAYGRTPHSPIILGKLFLLVTALYWK